MLSCFLAFFLPFPLAFLLPCSLPSFLLFPLASLRAFLLHPFLPSCLPFLLSSYPPFLPFCFPYPYQVHSCPLLVVHGEWCYRLLPFSITCGPDQGADGVGPSPRVRAVTCRCGAENFLPQSSTNRVYSCTCLLVVPCHPAVHTSLYTHCY